MTTNYRTVTVPADTMFLASKLIEGRLSDGRTTGLCRSLDEAQLRNELMLTELMLTGDARGLTEAPDGQLSNAEFAIGLAWIRENHAAIRGIVGKCALEAYERAAIDGIHSVEWARASRYAVAGYVPALREMTPATP